jgi:hypothetical protein
MFSNKIELIPKELVEKKFKVHQTLEPRFIFNFHIILFKYGINRKIPSSKKI